MTLEEAVQAASDGDIFAARQAVWVLEPCARLCEQAGNWERAAAYWAQYQDCQDPIAVSEEASEEERLAACRAIKRGQYGQGLACLHLRRVEWAISLLWAAAEDGGAVPGDEQARALLEELGD